MNFNFRPKLTILETLHFARAVACSKFNYNCFPIEEASLINLAPKISLGKGGKLYRVDIKRCFLASKRMMVSCPDCINDLVELNIMSIVEIDGALILRFC